MRNWLVLTHNSPICHFFIEGLNVSGVEYYLRCKLRFITPLFDRYFCVVIRSFLTSIATSASMNF